MKHQKKIVTVIIATAWVGLGVQACAKPRATLSAANAPTITMIVDPIALAMLQDKNNSIEREKQRVAALEKDLKAANQKGGHNLRPTPYMTKTDRYMLAIALGEEAGIDNDLGKQAMLNVVLNRVSTSKNRTTVTDVLTERMQFSFLWGATQTYAGKIMVAGNEKQVEKLALSKYQKELAFVNEYVGQNYYVDVTSGRTYYLNAIISSATGKKWFAENTAGCRMIGNHHKFCYYKNF